MRYARTLLRWTGLMVAGAALAVVPLAAQAEEYGPYAVVRALEGSSHLQPAQEGQPQALVMNLPVTEGDTVWTDDRGRVDLLLQEGNHVILDEGSRIEVDRLPSDAGNGAGGLRVRLLKGAMLLDMRVWSASMSGYVVSTPSAMLGPSKPGLYLLEVESVDRTRIACLEGLCSVVSAGESVSLQARQSTYAEYGYPPMAPMAAGVLPASFLKFRDDTLPRRTSSSVSQQYLPSNLSAWASDLDSSGDWSYDASYGYVWRPSAVASDWAPYSYGQWDYNPWGMTWVPYEPWGWAPFHYGRWIFTTGIGWGWCPMGVFAPAWCSFWWDDAGWFGWCPMDYWGGPLWGPAGWYSCGIGNIYNTNINTYIVRHRDAPPPRPIYPTAQGTPASLRGGGIRGPGSVNLSPQAVRAYRDGRVSASDLRARLTEPLPSNRRTYPSVVSSDRGGLSAPTTYDRSRGDVSTGRPGRTEPYSGRGAGANAQAGSLQPTRDRAPSDPRQPIAPTQVQGKDASAANGWRTFDGLSPSRDSFRSVEPREPLPDNFSDSRAPSAGGSRAPREPVTTFDSDGGGYRDLSPSRQPVPQPQQQYDRGGRSQSPSWGGASPAPSRPAPAPQSVPQSAPRYIPSRPSAPAVSRSAPAPQAPPPAPPPSGSKHHRN